MWQLLVPAITLGFISSFHCVGMCGPIALALPVHSLSNTLKQLAVVLYHAGRVTTYATLGLLFGLVGRQLYLAGFQRWFSIAAGIVVLAVVIQQQFFKKNGGNGFIQQLFYTVQGYLQYVWGKSSVFKFLFIGMLNGLLPCGMVYFALAATLSFSSPLHSIFFMAVFGLGTLPLMALLHFFGAKYFNLHTRNTLRKAVPVFIGCMGVLLILRGLNLGIPYLSPYMGKNPSQAIICH